MKKMLVSSIFFISHHVFNSRVFHGPLPHPMFLLILNNTHPTNFLVDIPKNLYLCYLYFIWSGQTIPKSEIQGNFLSFVLPFQRQILDSSKIEEFTDDNFKFDKNNRRFSKTVAKPHSSDGSSTDLRTGGHWFDPQLCQYSFPGLMIVIATGFFPLSPLSIFSTIVKWESGLKSTG